jgi:hypothetical protein
MAVVIKRGETKPDSDGFLKKGIQPSLIRSGRSDSLGDVYCLLKGLFLKCRAEGKQSTVPIHVVETS